MHWLPVETTLDGQTASGRYRIARDRVEVEWNGANLSLPYGAAVRPEVAAANTLRTLVRRARQAA
jgi:hypothetical protein